jgi:hypothetical protein
MSLSDSAENKRVTRIKWTQKNAKMLEGPVMLLKTRGREGYIEGGSGLVIENKASYRYTLLNLITIKFLSQKTDP